jgi:hypothetical protein
VLPFCPPLLNLKVVKKFHKTTLTRIFLMPCYPNGEVYTVSGHNLSFYFLFVIANAVPSGRQEMKQSLDINPT